MSHEKIVSNKINKRYTDYGNVKLQNLPKYGNKSYYEHSMRN